MLMRFLVAFYSFFYHIQNVALRQVNFILKSIERMRNESFGLFFASFSFVEYISPWNGMCAYMFTASMTAKTEKKILRLRLRYVSKRVDDKKNGTICGDRSSIFFSITAADAAAAAALCSTKWNIVWHSYNLLAIVLCANILSDMFKPHRFQFNEIWFFHWSISFTYVYTLQRTRDSLTIL